MFNVCILGFVFGPKTPVVLECAGNLPKSALEFFNCRILFIRFVAH